MILTNVEGWANKVHIMYHFVTMSERLQNFISFFMIKSIDIRYAMSFTDDTVYIYGHNQNCMLWYILIAAML